MAQDCSRAYWFWFVLKVLSDTLGDRIAGAFYIFHIVVYIEAQSAACGRIKPVKMVGQVAQWQLALTLRLAYLALRDVERAFAPVREGDKRSPSFGVFRPKNTDSLDLAQQFSGPCLSAPSREIPRFPWLSHVGGLSAFWRCWKFRQLRFKAKSISSLMAWAESYRAQDVGRARPVNFHGR
jgi:hypothetical protein